MSGSSEGASKTLGGVPPVVREVQGLRVHEGVTTHIYTHKIPTLVPIV